MADIASANIAVPADLEGANTTLNGWAQTIVGELDTLKRQLAPLEGSWTGTAAVAYNQLKLEWDTAAAGLFSPTGVLGQIANAMHVNWGNYVSAETANSQTWKH